MQSGNTFSDYGQLLRRRWRILATVIPGCVLGAVFLAFALPATYRASGTILLEPSEIPKELINSTARNLDDIPGLAQQALELVRRKVMTPERMLQVVKEVDPYPKHKEWTPAEKAERIAESTSVERVDPITLKPLDTSTAFSIYYDNPDPDIAANIVSKIVDLYVHFNRQTRIEESTVAYDFLASQAKQLEGELASQEQELAKFKAKYGGALPEMQARNLAGIDRLQHDLDQDQREILVVEAKESQLQLQLNTLSPSLSAAVGDWRVQLGKLRADLADAEQKYTPQHPEVKRLRRAIADMAAQGAASTKVGATPDNPDYLLVKSQLDGAQRELAALRANQARERAEIAQYEQNLTTTPTVERDYTQLVRDHENARARYEDLQTKMKNAALARNMETESRGEEFVLVHAPSPPSKPFFPNRIGMILLGIIVGCGLAFGLAALVDASDPTVRGSGDLQAIMDIPAMGTVPVLLNPRDRRRRRVRFVMAVSGYAAAVAVVAITVILKS